ncbi:hypothetical protein ACJVDH_12645 [Pedobacter sp. AW1-32]|uniref:hypothetical protein n=1 Tax=Pedobacter sp. AW1-32 TaxID=3383026 RepID=UPI003FEDA8D9
MNRQFKLVLLCWMSCLGTAFAQTGTGCLVGNTTSGTLYIDRDFLGAYLSNGVRYPVSLNSCPRARLNGASVGTCFLEGSVTPHSSYNYTILTATGPVACPLDKHFLVLVGGFLGYKIISKFARISGRRRQRGENLISLDISQLA